MKSKVTYSVENLVKFAREYLEIPDKVTIQIIENNNLLDKFSKNDLDIYALSYRTILPDHYQIFVKSRYAQDLLIIAHELIHIHQFVRGDLSLDLNTKIFKWKGEKYKANDVKYEDRPWEKEAFSKESVLLRAYKKFEKSK